MVLNQFIVPQYIKKKVIRNEIGDASNNKLIHTSDKKKEYKNYQ